MVTISHDEPISDAARKLLITRNDQPITILLVDQNITDAVRIAERVYLIGEGRVQREGSGAWFAAHLEEVIREMLQGAHPVEEGTHGD